MADPVTLMTIAVVAGGAMTAVGQVREGQQMAAAEKYSASVAEAQAGAVRESVLFQSETLKKQSELEQAKIAREKKMTLGAQRAAYAKAGVRLAEGSPLEVMADTAAQYELDLATSRYNLATGLETLRYGMETDVARLRSEAAYRRILAKQYPVSSYIKAGGTLLTTAGTVGLLTAAPVKAAPVGSSGATGGGSFAKTTHATYARQVGL